MTLPDGITVLERGWLSSNNILLQGRDDGEGATLVDSGHCLHAEQTAALVRHALGPTQRLTRIVNTHLHSDHCGGNAALQRAFGAPVVIPPGEANAVAHWDEDALSYRATGQRVERFAHDAVLRAGDTLRVGGRTWQALAAPGHDPHSLVLFDARDGVLISADALWADGFGVVFPELDGESAFDDVAAVLDTIERLARFVADPSRHAHLGAKVLLKYHLLEERRQPWPALIAWWRHTPLAARVWQRLGQPEGDLGAWGERLVRELAAGGALHIDAERGDVCDA